MKIYAPVKDANGTWASVRFVNGVGETNNPALVEWFRQHGYRIEDDRKSVVREDESELVDINKIMEEMDVVEPTEPDFESMTPTELREWAKANGLGSQIKNIRNREKLLELIRG